MTIILQSLFLIIGFVLLVKGADWFVEGSSGVAEKFHIPQLVIGLTIVAMGTSAPEAAVSITAVLKGSADITIGNVVGSNILNIFIILGIASSITAIKVAKTTIRYEIPFMLFVTLLLLIFGYTKNSVSRLEGGLLWFVFILYLLYMFWLAKSGLAVTEQIHSEASVPKLLFMTIIGLALIIIGSDVTVDAATSLATLFGVGQRFIGLTIVALGTSLPELFTSVIAAKKGKADIAIGNIVGSNIFNILFVVGTSALIMPVSFVSGFAIDCIVAFFAGIVLFVFSFKHASLNRKGGIVMLLCYLLYFIYLCHL